MKKEFNITDSEWKIMQVLWLSDEQPMTVGEIAGELEEKVDWNKRTIQTLIQRLHKKNVISYVDGRYYKYYANVSEDQCLKSEMKGILKRLFYSSPSKLISTLIEAEDYEEEDKIEIMSLLNRIEERHKND